MRREDVARHGSEGWLGGVEDIVALPLHRGIKESESISWHELEQKDRILGGWLKKAALQGGG
jgi:hypothetical protein